VPVLSEKATELRHKVHLVLSARRHLSEAPAPLARAEAIRSLAEAVHLPTPLQEAAHHTKAAAQAAHQVHQEEAAHHQAPADADRYIL